MPNMQRLTDTGICMHSGNLPGYPASHGCIRMPYDFSQLLFSATSRGGTVVVGDGKVPVRTSRRIPACCLRRRTSRLRCCARLQQRLRLEPRTQRERTDHDGSQRG